MNSFKLSILNLSLTHRYLRLLMTLVILSLSAIGANAYADPPIVTTVPIAAEDPLQPHDLISGKATTLKGAVDSASVGSTWTWDPGDGSPTVSGVVNPSPTGFAQTDDVGFTPYFAIWVEHTYTGNDGDFFIATLTVTNGSAESSSAAYRVVIRDKTLPVEVNVAIDEALWFMHRNQYRFNGAAAQANASTTAGSIPMSTWNFPQTGGTAAGQVTGTAAVINAFEANGYTETDGPASPYTETVARGLRNVIARLMPQAISLQSFGRPAGLPDNPDTNGNGIGVRVNGYQPPYQVGMAIDAVVASGTPGAIATTGPANVIGRTYGDIVQDMVDWYAWAQGDGTNTGGWRYGAWNNTTGQIDNSTSGWAAIGLLAAEDLFGATVPLWVKTRNEVGLELTDTESNTNIDGQHGYTNSPGPAWGGFGVTGAAMVEMSMDDVESTTSATPDERWIRAENFFRRHLGQPISGNNLRNYYYAMFNFAKGMRTAVPAEVVIIGNNNTVGCGPNGGVPGCGSVLAPLDWYSDPAIGLARTVVDFQTTTGVNIGMFTDRPGNSQGSHQDEHNTSWATQILTRTLFQAGPVARASASPNPGALNTPINFDARASFHQDAARSIVLYEWDFDNDGVFDVTGVTASRSFSETLCPTIPCTRPVILRVTDNNDPARFDTDIVNVEITIPPHPPTAVAGGPYLMCTVEEYPLDGTASFDIDEGDSETGQPPFDTITGYAWELDGISPFDFDEASGVEPLVSFPVPGIRDIGLRVTDNTSQAFPSAQQPDLTDSSFTTVEVADCSCIGPISARTKPGKAQLVWAPVPGAAGYDILRSAVPNRGFGAVAVDHVTDYATYLDRGLTNGQTYWYRVVPKDDNGMAICGFSQAVSATPQLSRRARTEFVRIPDVSGLGQSDAGNTLAVAGLGTGAVSFENSDTVPEGLVIRSDPAAGSSVAEGGAVALIVSLGPVRVEVPDVIGQTQSDAEAAIVAAGLTVGAVGAANSDTVPAGNVISQDPVGGIDVVLGSAVDLVVSLGPVTVAVPDVVGSTQAAGEAAILAAGLTVGAASTANSDTIPAGSIISQDPLAGTSVVLATAVDIVVSLGPVTVAVPDVIGLPQADAEAAIVAATLSVGTITTQSSSTVPAGNVINQSPGAGSNVLPGAAVDLTVSLGPVQVTVPDVVGLPQADAEAALVAADLGPGTITEQNSLTVSAGNVISQDPVAGSTVDESSLVDLVVSIGPSQVTVPDVVGLAQAAAESAIVAADLSVGNVTTDTSPTVPAGDVISQNPLAGIVVDEQSAVDIVVSEGPAPIDVPDVTGLPQATAAANIVAANLSVGAVTTTTSETVLAGDVISQNPVACAACAAPGSAVDMVVSEGPAPIDVPDVVGLPQAAAESAITGAGLAVGAVTTATSETVPAGDVISQNPVACTACVAPGSAVDIVVSEGPAPVDVPDVVGLPQAAAESAITGADLVVGAVSTATSDTVPAGDVISQNPVACTACAAPGSAVDIVVSAGPPVVVPNVLGLAQAAAESAITGVGLVPSATTVSHASVPAGDVISQDPAGGTTVVSGSTVNIVVSDGPVPVIVPDVVGLPQAAAESAITGVGLAVGAVSTANSDTVPAGDVISQNPVGGVSVAPGTSVDILVSEGPVLIAVPDVVGQVQATAEASIVAAGLTVGVVTSASDDTVLAGNVISQDPVGGTSVVAGSPVDLVVSTGPEGIGPATLSLSLGRDIVTAGDTIDIVPAVANSEGDPILPTPPITYSITFVPADAAGTLPTEVGAVISTSVDTRGIYTVTGTVDGTAVVSGGADFLVYRPAVESGQKAMYSGLSASVSGISSNAAALAEALAGGDVPGVQAALNGMRSARDAVDRVAMQRTTAFAPEGGFLPSTGELTAAGFPRTADDATLQIIINNIIAKIQETSSFYSSLNPAGANDDEATLAQLNDDLQTLLDQLNALNPTVHGWVEARGLVNLLLAVAIPQHLYAVVDRFETAILAEGIGVTENLTPADFYRQLMDPEQQKAVVRMGPEAYYAKQRQAFFGLSGMSVAVNIQMKIISNVYGPVLHDLARSAAILAANSLLNSFVNNAGLQGIITGASLSIHIWNASNSVIEVTGANRTLPQRSDVFLVGSSAVAAVEGVFTALDPSGIEDLDDVWEFFEGVVGALEAAGEAFDSAHQVPSAIFPSCILSSTNDCVELVYPVGFNSVNECSGFFCFAQPVLIIVHNLDTGTWAFDIFSFNP